MASKPELQTILKDRYRINKNISEVLTLVECQRLITLLEAEPSAIKIVESFIGKNVQLTTNNQQFGKLRADAEKKKQAAEAEFAALQASIQQIEQGNGALGLHKQRLMQQTATLEAEVEALKARSQQLEGQVQALDSDKKVLVGVNDDLKKDNKRLKNIVDAIRLKFSKELNQVLKDPEDGNIRKSLVKLYKSMLG
jgi:chromosome segregation ATPase